MQNRRSASCPPAVFFEAGFGSGRLTAVREPVKRPATGRGMAAEKG